MRRPSLPQNKIDLALTAAILSRDAYPLKRAYDSPLNRAHFICDTKTDTQCYVVLIKNVLHIVFRGTEKKLKDVITDLMVVKTEVPFDASKKLRAFKGFLRAFKSVRDEIYPLVKLYVATTENIKLSVTGHSMGGALSRWCALDLSYNDSELSETGLNIEHYDFGACPIGNRALADSFNKYVKKSYIVRNGFDPIPLLPLSGKHHERHIRLKPLTGHDIDNYIINLEQLNKTQK